MTTLKSHETYYDTVYHASSITDYQILQRNTKTNQVTVVIDNNWKRVYDVGGPYTIGKAKNVYVGDIWVMAGQSNMRGHGYQIDPYTGSSLIEHGQPGIHLYDSTEKWKKAEEPLHQLYLSRRTVHHTLPDPTVKSPKILDYRGASLGLAFAKHYRKKNANIPVGLVASAHGGTSMNDWARPDTINEETEDTTLYGAMLARIKAIGPIAGILWYQGESDTVSSDFSKLYALKFSVWLLSIRLDIGYAKLPFAFVQLGPHAIDVEETRKNWATVQLAQLEKMQDQVYTAGVSSVDCSLDDRLHLSATGLKKVGERLADVASKLVNPFNNFNIIPKDAFTARYQESILPMTKAKIPPCILFRDLGWTTEDNPGNDYTNVDVSGFGLECEDKNVTIIKATLSTKNGNEAQIWISHKPSQPLKLTYGLKYPLVELFNKGWPALSIDVQPSLS